MAAIMVAGVRLPFTNCALSEKKALLRLTEVPFAPVMVYSIYDSAAPLYPPSRSSE